jgi:hypothetical protein
VSHSRFAFSLEKWRENASNSHFLIFFFHYLSLREKQFQSFNMYYVLIILFAVLVCCFCDASVPEVVPKHLEILNDSGANLQVFWINPSTGQQMPFSQMYNGAHLSVDSFVNHTFVIRQTKLETKESRIGYVKVSNTDNQGTSIFSKFTTRRWCSLR